MVRIWSTVLVMGWIQLSLAEIGGRASGPYDVVIEKFVTCDDEGTGAFHIGTRITKSQDGKYLFNNPLYLGNPIDEHFKMHIELQSLGISGGYRPRFMQHTMRGCEAVWKHLKDAFVSFMKASGVTIEHCPIPTGNYTSKDYELNFHVDNIPEMFYNKYRAVLTSYYKEVKVGCVMIYGEAVPK